MGIVSAIIPVSRISAELERGNYANMALLIAHYGYVMENGKIVMEEAAANLRENPDVKEFYLGTASSGALRSYKDVKSYKRRKRWL